MGVALPGEHVGLQRASARVELGRDPTTLTLTAGMIVHDPAYGVPEEEDGEDSSFSGSVDELSRAIDEYAALDVGHVIVLLQPMTEASLNRLALALARRSGSV